MQQTLKLTEIQVEGRLREDLGDIEELAENIRDNGLLHPVVVEEVLDAPGAITYHYELRCGGRRYAAYTLLASNKVDLAEHPERPAAFYAEIPVTLFDEMPSHQRIRIEMEENLRRKEMSWKERVIGIVKYHKACLQAAYLDDEKWNQKMTGELLGMDQASVSVAFTVYDEIKKGNEKVVNADSLTDAIKVIAAENLDAAQAERLRRIQLKRAEQALSSGTDGKRAEGVQLPKISSFILHEANSKSPDTINEKVQCSKEEVAAFYHHGDALKVLPLLAKTTIINHIICDPPYGIDIENLSRSDSDRFDSIQRIAETHTVEGNLQLLPAFLRVAYEVIAEDGFLCMWYDLDHHEKIRKWAKEVGWRVTRWPFHWCKTSSCLNQAAQCNITKAVEHCYFFRRSEKSIIKKKQAVNFLCTGGDTSASHPFTKPRPVWDYLIETVSLEGQVIVDPFAGEGSSLAAIFQAKRVPIGVEIDEKHIASGLSFIQEKLNKKNILDDLLSSSVI